MRNWKPSMTIAVFLSTQCRVEGRINSVFLGSGFCRTCSRSFLAWEVSLCGPDWPTSILSFVVVSGLSSSFGSSLSCYIHITWKNTHRRYSRIETIQFAPSFRQQTKYDPRYLLSSYSFSSSSLLKFTVRPDMETWNGASPLTAKLKNFFSSVRKRIVLIRTSRPADCYAYTHTDFIPLQVEEHHHSSWISN